MRVLCDCDGVIADFVARVVDFVNLNKAPSVDPNSRRVPHTHDHVTHWDCFAALDAAHLQEAFDAHASTPGFCKSLPVLPGARHFVESLRELGCELVIVTAPYEAAQLWTHERLAWLREHFEIEKKDVVFCKRKELVKGDVLIDDALHNAEAFAAEGGRVLLIDRPWNQTERALPKGVERCFGYSDVLAALMCVTEPAPSWDDEIPFSLVEGV